MPEPGDVAISDGQNRSLGRLSQWLIDDAWRITDTGELMAALTRHMLDDGIDLWRVRLTIRTLHPQVIGITYTWQADKPDIEIFEPPHSILQSEQFTKSPYAAIFEGAGAIRRRLDDPDVSLEYPVLQEIHAEGATDYVAMPIVFSDEKINAITFATKRAGGFASDELGRIYDMLPMLSRLLEVHAMRRTARTLLDTYLGQHTGEQVLSGHVRRGEGENIHAVIWFCDLRDSTALAESMSREAFLGILNDYYDCMAGAVLDAGGEVLRFIGDAALAIFPTDGTASGIRACESVECAVDTAVTAAIEARRRIDELNEKRMATGDVPLRFGLALHMGELTYGNIGVPGRLEFTVIGAAANEAAKLEAMCKPLQSSLLVSAAVAAVHPQRWRSLGNHGLAGITVPREIFTAPNSVWPSSSENIAAKAKIPA